jgi:predicted transcriptional regulator
MHSSRAIDPKECNNSHMVGKSEQVTIRLDPELLALANEVADLVAKVAGLDEAARASIIRTAMRKGLEQMREELRVKASASKRTK